MESLVLKNVKPGTPVKDRSKSHLENANPNVSHAAAKSPLAKSSASSPLVKSANPKRSAQKKNQSPNPNPNAKPSQAVFSPRNRIRERRFVVVAKKKNSKKEKKDHQSPTEEEEESSVAEIDCKCGERKKGNLKCVCVAYETLRASQEEFLLKKRSESEEEVKEESCNLGEGEESVEPEVIGGLKRTRGKVVEESRRSVPESGKVMNLVEAFEKLTCFSTNKEEEEKTVGDVKQTVKLELCGMRHQSKFSEGEKETGHTWSSFCPNELVLTAESLGLDPNASVSSSWDSSHKSVMSGLSNAGRRSRRNSLDSTTTMGSRKSKKKQVKVTSLKPFNLRTEQRGRVKEEEFARKLQEITMVEEKMRIPIAQGLPWTTDEPECLVKPHVKDITIPVDLTLHSDVRAVERAEFDQQIAERMSFMEQYKMEREREQKLAEEEEIRRLRKELVPKAQPMPYFDRPFIPRRSSKHPTAPRDPKFHIPQHKKIRCCSSSSCSETASYMSDFSYQFL
ncbi:microtubule-destabilizing protein 60 isoform X2 [Raphanus sativus]|uniref:Microtubule-destabilizing protein 60 isoform X2 n=1 Tax=Raphanus sativus TaxID=3726 RepID=A0A6J0KXE8_RAPSA|nr:microtubule-destabilizing protein 60 isoform X2 [Raphanus sativus]